MLTAMNTLILLLTLLTSANAARDPCTAKDMEGLQIVGYGLKRVFRLTNYTGFLELDKLLYTAYDVSSGHIGKLVHLHQGFDRKLILLEYGTYKKEFGSSIALKENLYNDPSPKLAVIDDASVGSKEVVEMKRSEFNCFCIPEENEGFASFVYDDRVYYEGGYTDIRQERPRFFKFVSNASDLCANIKYPVVDIAFDPPVCYNRMLNETAESSVSDEWIVALVDGIQTTRSQTICDYPSDPPPKNIPTTDDEVKLPNHERFCYFLKKPGMKTPCLFAEGSRYLFTDVQVVPANPVRMAKKVASTINSPITTESAPETSPGQTSTEDEPKKSGAAATSKLLCGLSLLCFLWIL